MKKLFALATIAATAAFIACDNSSSSDDDDNGSSSSSEESSSDSKHGFASTFKNEIAACTVTLMGDSAKVTVDAGNYYTAVSMLRQDANGAISAEDVTTFGSNLSKESLQIFKDICDLTGEDADISCKMDSKSMTLNGPVDKDDYKGMTFTEYVSQSCVDALNEVIEIVVPAQEFGNDDNGGNVTCSAYVMGDSAMFVEYEGENVSGTTHFTIDGDSAYVNGLVEYPSESIATKACSLANKAMEGSCEASGDSTTITSSVSTEAFYDGLDTKTLKEFASKIYCPGVIEADSLYVDADNLD